MYRDTLKKTKVRIMLGSGLIVGSFSVEGVRLNRNADRDSNI